MNQLIQRQEKSLLFSFDNLTSLAHCWFYCRRRGFFRWIFALLKILKYLHSPKSATLMRENMSVCVRVLPGMRLLGLGIVLWYSPSSASVLTDVGQSGYIRTDVWQSSKHALSHNTHTHKYTLVKRPVKPHAEMKHIGAIRGSTTWKHALMLTPENLHECTWTYMLICCS